MISILDTGVANAASVLYAIQRLGFQVQVTRDPDALWKSQKLIIPGVGTAQALMHQVAKAELRDVLCQFDRPILGICLGMQVLYEFSAEGNVECLAIFRGRVDKIKPRPSFPLPHMGWNQVQSLSGSLLLKNIPENSYFYFVHSFKAPKGIETKAIAEYGEDIPAVIESANWFGTQFHPERSGLIGEELLKNFLKL